MNNTTNTDWNLFLVKGAGIALLTVALTWLPSALAGLMQIVFFCFFMSTSYGGSAFEADVITQLNLSLASTAAGKIIGFVVLVLLARWIMGYPKLIQSWFARADSAETN